MTPLAQMFSRPVRQASQVPQESTAAEPQTAPTSSSATLSAVESITRSHTEEVTLSAEIGDIWRGLTDIATIKQWSGGDGQFSPYIGGAYDLSFKDGTRNQGRIDIFMPPRRMRLVEAPREGEEPLATGPMTIDFRLTEDDGKTDLTVIVAGIPATEEWEEDYNRSIILWREALAELKDLLSKS